MFLFINIFFVRFNLNKYLHGGVEAINEGAFKIRTFLENPKYYFEKKSPPAIAAGSNEPNKNKEDSLKHITKNAENSINSDENVNQHSDKKEIHQNINYDNNDQDQEKIELNQNAYEIENEDVQLDENNQQAFENENQKSDIANSEDQKTISNNITKPSIIKDNINQENFENKENSENNINDQNIDEISNKQNQEIENHRNSSNKKNQEMKDNQNKEEAKNDQPLEMTDASKNQKIIENDQKQEIIKNNQKQEIIKNNQKQEIIKNDQKQEIINNQVTDNINNDQNPKKIENNPITTDLQSNQGIGSNQLSHEYENDQTTVKTKQITNQKQSDDEDYVLHHFNYIDSIIYEIRSNKQVKPPVLIGGMRKFFLSMKSIPAGKEGDYWEIAGKEANFTIHFNRSIIKGIELARTNKLCEIKTFQVLDVNSDYEILKTSVLKYPVQQFVFPALVSSDRIKLRVLENLGDKNLICLRNYSILAG